MKIIASNTDVANEIEHMAALVRAGGGYFHDDIVIREDAGNLWVEGGPTVEPKAKLATLSADCLIPVDCFDLESNKTAGVYNCIGCYFMLYMNQKCSCFCRDNCKFTNKFCVKNVMKCCHDDFIVLHV